MFKGTALTSLNYLNKKYFAKFTYHIYIFILHVLTIIDDYII